MPQPKGPRLLTLLALLVGGLVLGFIGAVVSTLHREVAGVDVPWGLVLVVVTVGCCVRGGAWLVGSRRGAAMVALGWVLPSLAFSAVNPGGDVVLTDEPRTYVYLASGAVISLLATLWPLPAGAAEATRAGSGVVADDEAETDLELDQASSEPPGASSA